MKFQRAARLIADLPDDQTTLLLGPPGIGKTALAKHVGQLVGESYTEKAKQDNRLAHLLNDDGVVTPQVEVRDLCSHLPEDLLGLPWRDNDVTHYCPQTWLARLCQPNAVGVLVLDDIAAAAPAIQTASFQLCLERRAGDHVLSPYVKIILTANRREDKSGASTLPAALRNRCWITEVNPDVDEWCEWAGKEKLAGVVPAYMRYKPDHLSTLPKDADARGAFATPRTWHKLALGYEAAKKHDAVYDLAAGLIGEPIAVTFRAFVKLRDELPDPRKILFDPEGVLPSPPKEADRLVAVVTALAEIAAPLSADSDKKAKEIPELFLKAVAHVSQKHREYASAGLLTYASNGGNVTGLVKAARANKHDPKFAPLLKHLKGALM